MGRGQGSEQIFFGDQPLSSIPRPSRENGSEVQAEVEFDPDALTKLIKDSDPDEILVLLDVDASSFRYSEGEAGSAVSTLIDSCINRGLLRIPEGYDLICADLGSDHGLLLLDAPGHPFGEARVADSGWDIGSTVHGLDARKLGELVLVELMKEATERANGLMPRARALLRGLELADLDAVRG
jgi:hypothetical protein